ncbi:hypothetical protein ACJMK2_000804 [Sinanodonta woodiana]|uniref:RBPJ-interacting and tubulin-associated protein 1 n=1 Tax=Sinanodonta woodiana TaxID=1069815 RepID=A0ABD3XQD6_SINWO
MATGGIELVGSRPPSVMSRPPSSSSARSRSRSGYHLSHNASSIHESLFTSHNPTKNLSNNTPPPWPEHKRYKDEDKKKMEKPKMRPLLWAPPSPAPTLDRESGFLESVKSTDTENSRLHKFRALRHTPTFVDESLFGPKLQDPSFDPPWVKKTAKAVRMRPLLWCPQTASSEEGAATSERMVYSASGTLDGRPPSRLGRRPASAKSRPSTVESTSMFDQTKPIWKP